MATSEKSESVRAGSRDLADKAADTIDRAADSLKDAGDRLSSQTAEIGENLSDVAGNFAQALDKSVAEKPMTTLGVAVVFGFVLGALWKA